ncbi:MAG TPA: hypothetical protein DIW81_15035 [Planctomycetaceae bacterium]|nr:hypothetical protein [Rubinisphaera sp.]HCS52883.1 hypothetical protein [Planctomycetaceae bacterium]|tara:strand:- start:3708 stop:5408 length:1701 start_codon:yes stop_codon:yes gene_type:complete
MTAESSTSRWIFLLGSNWSGGIILGLLAGLIVILTIDPGGSYPRLAEGPGITIDESFNVQQGILLVEVFRQYGLFMFDPTNSQDIYGDPGKIPYLPDHPPLGRWVLGITHHLWWNLFPPNDPGSIDVTAAARVGSAVMFTLTVFLVGATAGTWFGPAAGWIAPLSLLLMPRLFAHAHLASLESSVNLFVALAVLCTAHSWSKCFRPDADVRPLQLSWKAGLIPGLYLGLAMLTKIQGFLIIPCIIGWALWYGRKQSILPLLSWGIVANLVFFLGWPWLWLDPLGNLSKFLGSATDRVHLNVWYLGQVFQDTEVPWHYPWVIFLVTVPVGLHLLGGIGLIQFLRERGSDARLSLVLICLLFPLLLFSTSTAVYDGSRLFLMAYPLWAIFIGWGGQLVWQCMRVRFSFQRAAIVTAVFLSLQAIGILSTHPNQLSYYNLLAGGTANARHLGFEATYWQDSLTRSFWEDCAEKIPAGATIHVMPVLHQFQLDDLKKQIPIIRKQQWNLKPWSTDETETNPEYLIVFSRYADIPAEFRDNSREAVVTIDVGGLGILKGTRIAALYLVNSR